MCATKLASVTLRILSLSYFIFVGLARSSGCARAKSVESRLAWPRFSMALTPTVPRNWPIILCVSSRRLPAQPVVHLPRFFKRLLQLLLLNPDLRCPRRQWHRTVPEMLPGTEALREWVIIITSSHSPQFPFPVPVPELRHVHSHFHAIST